MPLNDVLRQRMQPLTAAMTSNRIILYAIFSTAAMLGAILNACRNQSNFYSVAVYLSRSGRSLLILANFGILFALVFGKILQKIFFGPLQPREVERLYDQTWMFVTESLLAFTIFRDEFDVPFLLMFGFLLFVKCFHWLMADRVESMEQVPFPGPPFEWHIRMNCLFLVLFLTDLAMFTYAVDSTLANGVGGMVLFATEYAILVASTMNAMARYLLNFYEYRRARRRGRENAPAWESKSMYVFYIELVTDFLKLITYLTFFMIILTFYGLPLNIIRDVYLTARSFITRLRALVRYLNATRDMDRRYPNATDEELNTMTDRTCIICREELVGQADGDAAGEGQRRQDDGPNITPKKLPCGHIFHFQCLKSWLERQQSCPTCRRTVLDTPQQNRGNAPRQGQQQGQPQPNARPQPGMAPQPGQQPQPLGGVAGWLARLLGVPAMAAAPNAPPMMMPMPQQQWMVPPQPGFIPPNLQPGLQQQQQPQPQPQPGALPGQQAQGQQGAPPGAAYAPPIGYPYPYPVVYPPPQMHQYQYPPPMVPYYPQAYQPPAHPLNPPPHLRGFQGPGGQIHPWPIAPQAQRAGTPGQQPPGPRQTNQGVQAGQAVQAVQATQTQTTPTPVSTATTPTGTTASGATERSRSESDNSATSNIAVAPSNGDPGTPRSQGRADSPRNAAALAALRRLDALVSSQATGTDRGQTTRATPINGAAPSPMQPSTTQSAEVSSVNGSAEVSITPGPVPPPASTRIAQQQPSAAVATSNATSTAQSRQNLPSLIPAPDLSPRPGSGSAHAYSFPQGTTVPPHYRNAGTPTQTATVRAQMNFPAGPPPPYAQSAHQQTQQLRQRHQPQHQQTPSAHSGTPLSELPPTLTDEQLGRLDRLTRDAIDERLRVLEGVSGAVYRCVEELTRMRSVLPRSSPQQSAAQSSNVNDASSSLATTQSAATSPPQPSVAAASVSSNDGATASSANVTGGGQNSPNTFTPKPHQFSPAQHTENSQATVSTSQAPGQSPASGGSSTRGVPPGSGVNGSN